MNCMKKKNFLVATYFVLLAVAAGAQVYTINPIYNCVTMDNSFYSIDTFTRGIFLVDLDKMTFTTPISILSTPKIFSIKKVTRLENNLFKLILKKDNRYSPNLFYLKLDKAGKPLYIQKDHINIETYTTTAAALTLNLVCSKVKKVQVPYTSGAAAPDDTLAKANKKAVFIEGYNKFEMENDVITWTEGKGSSSIIHNIVITKSYVSTRETNYYIQLVGEEADGSSYSVAFFRNRNNYPNYYHMYVEHIEKNTWTAITCY